MLNSKVKLKYKLKHLFDFAYIVTFKKKIGGGVIAEQNR